MKRARSRWTPVHGSLNCQPTSSRKRVIPDQKALPCEIINNSRFDPCRSCSCPFLGLHLKDIRELLLDSHPDLNDIHPPEKKGRKNPSSDQPKHDNHNNSMRECLPIDLDIDVVGNLNFHFLDSSSILDTETSEEFDDGSEALIVPYEVKYAENSTGLVPYSDDEDDTNAEDDTCTETLTPPQTTTGKAGLSIRSACSDSDGFHDEFCTFKRCRETNESKTPGNSAIYLFDVQTPNNECTKQSAVWQSARSEAESGYWSFRSERSTTNCETPRSSEVKQEDNTEDIMQCEAETKEAKRRRTRELLDKMLPPLPEAPCPSKLQGKFDKLFALKNKGLNLIELIKKNHNYQNPYFMENVLSKKASFEVEGTQFERGLHIKSFWNDQSMYTRLDQGGASPN